MSGPSYLGIPELQVPLPTSPLPSQVPTPEPMPQAPLVDHSQPAYVGDLLVC